MALPTTAQAIHDLLLADTALAAALGTILLPGAATAIPGIAVLKRNERLPEQSILTGVCVIISGGFAPKPQVMLTGETAVNPSWRIYVGDWGGGDPGDLETVALRVIANLPGCSYGDLPAAGASVVGEGREVGLVDQVPINWTNPTVQVAGVGFEGAV